MSDAVLKAQFRILKLQGGHFRALFDCSSSWPSINRSIESSSNKPVNPGGPSDCFKRANGGATPTWDTTFYDELSHLVIKYIYMYICIYIYIYVYINCSGRQVIQTIQYWLVPGAPSRTGSDWTGHRRIFLIDCVWCITSLWTCGWHTFTCHQCILLFVSINSLIYWFSLLLASRRSSRLLNNNNTYHDWRSRINYSVQGPWLDLFYGPKCPFLSAPPVCASAPPPAGIDWFPSAVQQELSRTTSGKSVIDSRGRRSSDMTCTESKVDYK